jgi:muconolactone delta-isomerase
MKILAIEKATHGSKAEDFQPYLKAEAARVWELYQEGIIREFYFRQDQHNAVLVLECTSITHAKEVLATLPLVKASLIDFELIPLAPYPGLARLFEF